MKSIMLSIRPKSVEEILNNEKTFISQKKKPKYDLPIKVYIYCIKKDKGCGKVVGEFICDSINEFKFHGSFLLQCLIKGYSSPPCSFMWHISDLVIYDKPKELGEFSHFISNNECKEHENGLPCEKCKCYDKEHEDCMACFYSKRPIKKPPQSWCYVENYERF